MATRQPLIILEKPRIFSYQWGMTTLSIYRVGLSPYQNQDFPLWEKERLESLGHEITYSYAQNLQEISNDSIVITNTNIATDFLGSLDPSKLKLVLHPNSGYDNYSINLVNQLKCPVVIGNSIRAQGVAEYILGCLFTHFSKPPFVESWDPKRQWQRELLSEKKLVLLGHGYIGKILEQSLKPLVGELSIYDPYKGKQPLDIAGADIIIPVPSLNSSSHHLINEDFLKQISKNAVIINGSRGKIICEKDLISWLSNNNEAFAYLDVFEEEPHQFKEFKNFKNIKYSSHIAGVSKNLDQKILDFEEDMIKNYLAGKTFQNTLKDRIIDGELI